MHMTWFCWVEPWWSMTGDWHDRMLFSHGESWSLMAVGEMTLVMVKRLAHLWLSFFMGWSVEYFWTFNHTCLQLCILVHSDGSGHNTSSCHPPHIQEWPSPPLGCTPTILQRYLWPLQSMSSWVPPLGRCGCWLALSLNGGLHVVAWALLLYVNLVRGSQWSFGVSL